MNQIDLNRKLKRFVVESGANFGRLSEAFGETQTNLWRWLNGSGAVHLGLRQLENLASYVGASPAELLVGPWNIDSWRKNLIEGPLYLNEKYFLEAFSRARSSAHIVRYLALRLGRSRADEILRGMGVHPCIYSALDNRLSLDFFVDLLMRIELEGVPEFEVTSLASYMFLGLQDTQLGDEFRRAKNYFECYEVLNRNFINFDENFSYELKLGPHGFLFRAMPADRLAKKIFEGQSRFKLLALYRHQMMGWFPYLSGLAPITTKMVKSLAYGDPFCEIKGEFPMENRPSLVRPPPTVVG